MESTTHQLSTYPHLVPVDNSPGTIYQATCLRRRRHRIGNPSDHQVHLYQRSESPVNLRYQYLTSRRVNDNTFVKYSPTVSNSTISKDEDDRKGELRYDFKFGGDFRNDQDTNSTPLQGRRDRNSVFTVASARTLCSLSHEPSPPVSPSSQPPPSIFGQSPKTEHMKRSSSTLTPMLVEKHHGLYCRLKTFLTLLFRLKPDTTVIENCEHKFRHGRCKKCDLPEAILPYLGGLRAGFYCKEHGCEECSDCTSTLVYDTYGPEEELRDAPLQINSSIVPSLLYADTPATDNGSRSTISSEAPQIGPIDFIPIAQYTRSTSEATSDSSITSTNFSPDFIFESSPTPCGTPELNTSPTDYSLSVPPYLPAHHRNTSTPCPRPTVVTPDGDSTPSPRSTDSNEILEVNVPATAVPMIQASPTTIRIRHSRSASQPPAPPKEEEMQNLHHVAREAVHGDIERQTMILKMYQDILSADTIPVSSSHYYTESEKDLIKKARLVLGFEMQKAAGRMAPGLVQQVSAQLLPQGVRDGVMPIDAFAAYICQAVVEQELSEARATQILALADDERGR